MNVRLKSNPIAYRSVPYAAMLFIIGVLQVSFFSRVNVFSSVPDLLLGAIVALAMLEDERICMIAGIVSGFIYYALGAAQSPAYILFSFAMSCLLPKFCRSFPSKSLRSFLIFALLAYSAKAIYDLAEICVSGNVGIFTAFFRLCLPSFASSMVFCSVSYFITKGAVLLFNKKIRNERN